MSVRTVAILSPGDMGAGVGYALGQNEFDVITCLRGRATARADLPETPISATFPR